MDLAPSKIDIGKTEFLHKENIIDDQIELSKRKNWVSKKLTIKTKLQRRSFIWFWKELVDCVLVN